MEYSEILTIEEANNVYNVLVSILDAPEDYRPLFVDYMIVDSRHKEFRFQGKLGFGGKYWPNRNEVDCYKEDLTNYKEVIMHEANNILRIIRKPL